MTSCAVRLMSVNNAVIPTIQAPTPKKKRIKPGNRNSSRKKPRPTRNQMTDIFEKISMACFS
jgi:hypothetical protein